MAKPLLCDRIVVFLQIAPGLRETVRDASIPHEICELTQSV